ncbi:MAG: hypothetical protein BA066_07645 [Candidatus Korarchaeota archaeon NZ13-K]|nr:MAG: hypothetical protein BA066_07645 [Candidatus Korarchaeota archaeon NZ13-K]
MRVRKELEELVEYLAQRYGLRNEWVRNTALAVGLIVLSEGLRSSESRGFVKEVDLYVRLAKLVVLEREKLLEAARELSAAQKILEVLATA